MLPEWARRFEKRAQEGRAYAVASACWRASQRAPLLAHEAEVMRRYFAANGEDSIVLWTTVGAWLEHGRPTFVVDHDLFMDLCHSDPAPSPVYAPTPAGALWVAGGHGGGVIWAPDDDVHVSDVGIVASCLYGSDPERPAAFSQFFAFDTGLSDAIGYKESVMPTVGLWNLFALLADRAVSQAPVNGGHARALRVGERVKAARRSYTRLSLTEPIRRRTDDTAEPTGRHVAAHIRRGHWKRYWVRDPEGRVVLAKKQGKHGELHEVRQWVRPCKVGEGEPRRREYLVGL